MTTRLEVEYVLPLLRRDTDGEEDLIAYLREISELADVTVVDASESALFDRLETALPPAVRHVRPFPAGRNGKARGAMTGIEASRHDCVMLGDDDVRYAPDQMTEIVRRLESVDFVRPQNRYEPCPWQAKWDTGRILVGRALDGDYSGTVALRRSSLLAHGGYDCNVLFENLELERTMRAIGGRVEVARDIVVVRRPPSVRQFLRQRVRQAYDDLAQPPRLIAELLLLPVLAFAILRRRHAVLLAFTACVVALAERGRRRTGGLAHFPPHTVLYAPLWAAERSVTVWAALVIRLRGGVSYNGTRLVRAANPMRELKRRTAEQGGRYR